MLSSNFWFYFFVPITWLIVVNDFSFFSKFTLLFRGSMVVSFGFCLAFVIMKLLTFELSATFLFEGFLMLWESFEYSFTLISSFESLKSLESLEKSFDGFAAIFDVILLLSFDESPFLSCSSCSSKSKRDLRLLSSCWNSIVYLISMRNRKNIENLSSISSYRPEP